MFQSDNLFPHLSVKQNLMLGINNNLENIENKNKNFLNIFSFLTETLVNYLAVSSNVLHHQNFIARETNSVTR